MGTEESSSTAVQGDGAKCNQDEQPQVVVSNGESSAESLAAQTDLLAEESQAIDPEMSTEQLLEKLRETQTAASANWDSALRAQAELENLRKRAQRDVENAHKYGLERFVEELLPIRDSMELGLSAASEDGVELSSVREGVALTLKMLDGAIAKFGIEEINPLDETFNPEFHQAMTMQEVDGVASGTVTMVMQKGYLLNGRLVRPALVIVAK